MQTERERMRARNLCIFSLAVATVISAQAFAETQQRPPENSAPSPTIVKAYDLFNPDSGAREKTIAYFRKHGKYDAIPVLIQALRFARGNVPAILEALKAISGENPGNSWHAWMLWQQAHPEIKPPNGFVYYKAALYANIDPNFGLFLYPGVAHEIRIEEIVWGGIVKDAIPALTNPKLVATSNASYITPEELVFGVEINGDVRAYPLRVLDWHEMFNDVVGDVPVSLAYCTLRGSEILFASVKGREKPFVFGSSGFLYRSNKLMYDSETNSLWNQFTGKPVVGKLVGSGIEFKPRPVVITSWANWLKDHANTRVRIPGYGSSARLHARPSLWNLLRFTGSDVSRNRQRVETQSKRLRLCTSRIGPRKGLAPFLF